MTSSRLWNKFLKKKLKRTEGIITNNEIIVCSIVSDVMKTVLTFLFIYLFIYLFFYEKILQAQKALKSTKKQIKAQKAQKRTKSTKSTKRHISEQKLKSSVFNAFKKHHRVKNSIICLFAFL